MKVTLESLAKMKSGTKVYQGRSHYYRFDDELGDFYTTQKEAASEARAMRDMCDPVHKNRADMGCSVDFLIVSKIPTTEALEADELPEIFDFLESQGSRHLSGVAGK